MLKLSRRTARASRKTVFLGMTLPARKAPKSAWIPMASVMNAEKNAVNKTAATAPLPRDSSAARPSSHRPSAGRTTKSIAAMCRPQSAAAIMESASVPCRETAATGQRAPGGQVVAAHGERDGPGERLMPRSWRILAKTGNAVMLIAMPIKRQNGVKGTPAGA